METAKLQSLYKINQFKVNNYVINIKKKRKKKKSKFMSFSFCNNFSNDQLVQAITGLRFRSNKENIFYETKSISKIIQLH